MTTLRSGSASDVGLVRANNQDNLLVAPPLFAVADGMGGHAAGEVASKVAVEALAASFAGHDDPAGLLGAARSANLAVFETAQRDRELRGMGTTLVALALVHSPEGEILAVVNVGDSRLYRLRDGALEQITRDHSLVQELVDDGQLSEAEAAVHPQRHVLTRALGVDADVTPDLLEVTPLRHDRYLLCSDGLPREVSDNRIASILRRLRDPGEAAKSLIAEAKSFGGSDNITVVLVDVTEDDQDHMAASKTGVGSDSASSGPGRSRDSEPTELIERVRLDSAMAGGTTRVAAAAGAIATPAAAGAIATPAAALPAVEPGQSAAVVPTAGGARVVTFRVVAFVLTLLVLAGSAVAAVAWYARGSYFVSVDRSALVIYQGRPGGLLWFKPTVAMRTGVSTKQVLAVHLQELKAGKEEGSIGDARSYVSNLTKEAARARAARRPVTVPATTVPATTVPATSVPGATVPGATVPGATVPGATVPGATVPGATVPGATVPGATVPATGGPVTAPGSSTVPGTAVPASG